MALLEMSSDNRVVNAEVKQISSTCRKSHGVPTHFRLVVVVGARFQSKAVKPQSRFL